MAQLLRWSAQFLVRCTWQTAIFVAVASATGRFSNLTSGSSAAHTCGLLLVDPSTGASTAYCWGFNSNGQLGDGTLVNRANPTLVNTALVFFRLAVGWEHTCGLDASGAAYCWGNNGNVQLGDGTTTRRATPVAVSTSLVASFLVGSLVAGQAHSCGLSESGAAYCWGWNVNGQLGDGSTTQRSTPVAVSTSLVASYVRGSLIAGNYHTCGLSASGAAYCWGMNTNGQLGDGTTTQRTTPVAVSTSLVASFVSGSLVVGYYFTCGLTASGAAYCWGMNTNGQLGDGTTTQRTTPVAVSTSLVASFVSGSLVAGEYHTCGLAVSGAAYCWGKNTNGQLGDGTTTQRTTPVAVSTSLVASFLGGRLVGGSYHTCGLTASGAAYCWGDNSNGQLGLGVNTTTQMNTPVAVDFVLPSSLGTSSSTASLSQSPSHTPNATRSTSPSPSPSTTGTQRSTSSPTPTVSQSMSPTCTLTRSQALSASLTETPSASGTSTQTETSSQTPTASSIASASPSQTASKTMAVTRTATPSESLTQTASQTQSRSSTLSSTTTTTGSVSPIASLTSSASLTQTPSVAQTASRTQLSTSSSTQTQTPSASPLPLQASTESATQSPSTISTASASATPTLTISPSQTATQTRTPSTSREPYALLFTYASLTLQPSSSESSSGTDSGLALAVSDSRVAVSVTFALSRCPTESGGVFIASMACWVSPAGPLAPPNASTHEVGVALFQSVSLSAVGPIPCDPTVEAPVALGITDAVGAYVGSSSGAGALTCRVTTGSTSSSPAAMGSILAIGTQPVSIFSTLWPLWDDAILVTDFGLLRSPRFGFSINGTQQLLQFAGSSNMNAAVRNLSAVLAAVQSVWASLSLPNPLQFSAAASTFSMTLTGSTIVVLRATQAAFRDGISATLGMGTCVVGAVSDDGMWMALVTPQATATCVSDIVSSTSPAADCGYVTLMVNTTAADSTSGSNGASAIFSSPKPLGVALSCPPFCPGAVRSVGGDSGGSGATAVPFPLADGTFGFAANPSDVGAATPPVLASVPELSLSLSTSTGIYYALACAQTGVYTDPTTGACSNASDPAAFRCAYGAGESCELCPSSALCPGGFRMWPRAGYWTVFDSAGGVTQCAEPNSASRCTGWSVALGATLCGTGYLQGSALCGACAPGFFLQDDGTCTTCPVLKSAWDRYHTLLYILFVLLGIVLLVWAGLLLLVRLRGGTLLGGAARMLDLFVWGLLSAQVVSNAATVSTPTLPPLLASLYRAAAVLQLQGVLLPPACTGAYPFESQVSQTGLALSAWVLCVAAFYARRALAQDCRLYKAATLLGRAALTLALVLYSSSSSSAVSLLNCVSTTMAARSVSGLDGGDAEASSSVGRGATATVRVLVSNPLFACWAGSHRPAGALAAVALVLYVLALPVVLIVWVWADPWLQTQLRAVARADTRGNKGESTSGLSLNNPLQIARTARHKQRMGFAGVLGSASSPRPCPILIDAVDPLLLPILGDYVPSAWYTKLIDVALLLALSLLRALVPQPATLGLIVAKAAVSCTLLLAVCAHVVLVQTFLPQQAWKGWVRALLLFDSAGCALLNAAVSAQDAGFGGPRLAASTVVGSYLLFIMCGVTLGVLLWQFGASMYKGAEAEQNERVEAESAHSATCIFSADDRAAIVLGAHMQPLPQSSTPLSSDAEHAQAVRMVINPIQPRSRSGRGKPRTRPLARFSFALRDSGGDPEAARVACVALRDAFHLAHGGARTDISTQDVPAPAITPPLALVSPRAPVTLVATEVASAVGALSDALMQHASGSNTAVVQAACEGLRAAAVCDPAAVPALIAAGAPRGLLAALFTHGAASDAIACAACGALGAVAVDAAGASALVDAGGVGGLASVLHAALAASRRREAEVEGVRVGVGEAASEACRVLAELAAHEGAVHRLADSSVIEALVDVLATAAAALAGRGHASAFNVAAATYAAKTVAAVTLSDDALVCFVAAGGVGPLISLLQAWLAMRLAPRLSADASARRLDEAAVMSTHASEAMLSLSTRAQGAAALFAAGAMPALLEAISVASTSPALATDSVNDPKRSWALWEAACWALRGFSRDRRQLCALTASNAAARVAALLAFCEAASTAPAPFAEAEAEVVGRVTEHARTLLTALAHATAQCGN